MTRNFPDNHKPKIKGMIIVRRYEAADEGDLSARVRLVFASWINTLYNGDKEMSMKMSEATDEQSGSTDTSINSKAT